MYKKFLLIGSGNFVNGIRPALSGLALEVEIANTFQEIRPKLKKKNTDIILFDADSYSSNPAIFTLLKKSKINFVIFSGKKNIETILDARHIGSTDYILKPYNIRELNVLLSAILNNEKKVSCIGGGTGLFNLLMGLKSLPGILLTSIVSTTD